MTAINFIATTDAAHLLTDGAAYDYATGNTLFNAPKVAVLPNINGVLAVRGPYLAPALLGALLSANATSFDDGRGRAVDVLRSGVKTFGPIFQRDGRDADIEIFVAGWSSNDGPDGYLITNHAKYPGIEPWTVTSLGASSFAPGDDALRAEIAAFGSADNFDLAVNGLEIMEKQRQIPVEIIAGKPTCIVGGFCQLTTITERQITTRILRSWDSPAVAIADAWEEADAEFVASR